MANFEKGQDFCFKHPFLGANLAISRAQCMKTVFFFFVRGNFYKSQGNVDDKR